MIDVKCDIFFIGSVYNRCKKYNGCRFKCLKLLSKKMIHFNFVKTKNMLKILQK